MEKIIVETNENCENICIEKIKKSNENEILKKLCYIKEKCLNLNYIYFKYFATKVSYNCILNYIVKNIDNIHERITSKLDNELEIITLPVLNIDDNNNISLTIQENKTPKKVSWDDNITEEPIMNIFQKLKKQTPIPSLSLSPSNQVEEQQQQQKYVEQKSIPLPEVKQEKINRDIITSTQLTPIIPKNEMVKQLNEMNEKIDNLYEMVAKLTNLVQDVLIKNDNKNDKDDNE